MSGKLTRNESTPELQDWWRSVNDAAERGRAYVEGARRAAEGARQETEQGDQTKKSRKT